MADTKKYVSLENLSLYHEKEVARVDEVVLAAKNEAIAHADSLATNYDVAGAAKTVQDNLDAEVLRAQAAEETNAAAAKQAQDEVDALELKVGAVPEGSTVMGIIENIQENAYDDTEIRGLITGLDTNKADKEQVATDIADAVKVETDARVEAVAGVQNAVNTLSGTHATDKKALEDAIALKADKTSLDEVSETLAAVKEDVDAFFADADMTESAKDTLKELQTYIANDETAASQMAASIKQNSDAIKQNADDIDALEGKMEAVEDKLDTVAEGAQVNVIETVKVNGTALTVTDKTVDVTVPTGALANKDAVAEADLDTALASKINGKADTTVMEKAIEDAIDAEELRVDGLLDKKVDKVDGKGLSTNDLTDELKANYDAAYDHSQVAHAPANAQENVIETVKVNGTAVTVTDKAVDITVPTDNAELTNGAGYLVANDIANKADKATTLAGYGIADAYTSAQTDQAIADAISQFEEITEDEINALFTA